MSLLQLLWRNMVHRKVLSLLTVGSVAFTVALLVFLLLVQAGVEKGAEKGYGPFEIVIGADGSESQLALNTFYHIGSPTGNIPFSVFQEVQKEEQTESAFALTMGDNLNGFPIVGVDPAYFPVRYGDKKLTSGKLYAQSGEAVVGAYVAKSLGLQVGDTFHGGHGLTAGGEVEEHEGHEEHGEDHGEDHGHEASGKPESSEEHAGHEGHEGFLYKVTGILPPLQTSDDRAVFTTLDYAWKVHGANAQAQKDVTTIIAKPKSLMGAQALKLKYDRQERIQAVFSSKAVADVVNIIDKGNQIVTVITGLAVVLAAVSVLLSLVAAVNERKRDVGLLRLIGKTRSFVWMSLIGEGLLLTASGLVLGLLLGHIGSALSVDPVFAFSGVQLQGFMFAPGEAQLIGFTLLTGFAASLGPAMSVYRVDPLQLFRS